VLWVGWFGFNAGSELAADGMAMLVTQIATATAGLGWMIVEWIVHKKASVLGIITGAVAGLVAITPASGAVGPMGAQLAAQFTGVLATLVYTTIATFIIFKVMDVTIGLRVTADEESEGLDLALHNETGYNL
jgi:Amt family ammonium transporter